jgi:hypothetical protein
MYNTEEENAKTAPLTEDEYHTILGYLDAEIKKLQNHLEYNPSCALSDNEKYVQFVESGKKESLEEITMLKALYDKIAYQLEQWLKRVKMFGEHA